MGWVGVGEMLVEWVFVSCWLGIYIGKTSSRQTNTLGQGDPDGSACGAITTLLLLLQRQSLPNLAHDEDGVAKYLPGGFVTCKLPYTTPAVGC